MIFNDNNIVFEVEYIMAMQLASDKTDYERDFLNRFSHCMYRHYVSIRDCVNHKKCKKLKVEVVRERLENADNKAFVIEKLSFDEEKLLFVLDYCEINFKNII